MDWKTLQESMRLDTDYPERTRRLMALDRVLDGTQYDHLVNDYWDEETITGSPIPMKDRRPCVQTNIVPVTVGETTALLFGEDRFPRIRGEDAEASQEFDTLAKKLDLRAVMVEAAKYGSVGSVAIEVMFMADRVFFQVMRTAFLTPEWDPREPDRLVSVRERYKCRGEQLIAAGFAVRDADADYWFTQEWTRTEHVIYRPVKVMAEDQSLRRMPNRGRSHNLGEVPIVWIKNLPGGAMPDGESTFRLAVTNVIALDYCESQADRAMRYMGDPLLVTTGADAPVDDEETPKGPNREMALPQGATAEILEINGGSVAGFKAQAERLRNLALGAMHGNRHDPNRLSAATSGRAMELLHQDQIWLADNLRIAYGRAIGQIFTLIARALDRKFVIQFDGEAVKPFSTKTMLLVWGAWFEATYGDLANLGGAVTTMTEGAVVSHESATQFVARTMGITDVAKERKQIEAEQAELDARLVAQKAQTEATVKETS